MPRPAPPASDSAKTLTVEEAAAVLRIGRTAAYEGVRRGEIPHIRIGNSIRVPVHRLNAMLDGGGE